MDNMDSPLRAYNRLLGDVEPAKAAKVLKQHMSWHWSEVAYNYDAPSLVRETADRAAWERFSPKDQLPQKEVAAHCLFRAAIRQTGAARALLIDLAQSLVSDIVNAWLQNRPNS
jgi:hypothetical protein